MGRGPAPAQPAMWKLWACLPKKTPLPALHPRPYAQKGLCLPTSRPADQMWAWGMAGRPKEPGGHLICNWALCTPHLPAYSSLTTAQLKSTLRGNGPSVHLHALNHKIPKKVHHFGKTLSSWAHCLEQFASLLL